VPYDTKDGLAGSTVYDMCQDKDGFMWFGTENGLSRYDGTRFKNFTVKDGLPDNEVLKLFPDSKGRIWIGTFNKDICYYYKGRIYNKGNTNWMNKIQLVGAPLSYSENSKGTILVSDYTKLYEITSDLDVIDLNSIIPDLKRFNNFKIVPVKNYYHDDFLILVSDSLFSIKKKALSFFRTSPKLTDRFVVLKHYPNGNIYGRELQDTRINQTIVNSNTLFVSTTNGSWLIDTTTFFLKYHFLEGIKITHTILDNESNIWFSTIGEGVFKLPSMQIKNISFSSKQHPESEIFSITGLNDTIYCGLGFSKVGIIKRNKISAILSFEKYTSRSVNNSSRNILHSSYLLTNGTQIFGFDAFLVKYENGTTLVKDIIATKSIDEMDGKKVLVGTFNRAIVLNQTDFTIIDTIYNGRCTKVFYDNGCYYIGTLNGLFLVTPKKEQIFLGDLNYVLKRRVNDIKKDNAGRIWVATNDAGLIAIKEGKIVKVYSDSNGLSSNICKVIFIKGNDLYVGTNRGLNKINVGDSSKPIIKYSISDGLPSDIINGIYKYEKYLYVASPKGLTYFNEDQISNSSICKLYLENVIISGVEYFPTKKLQLSYRDNNIKFNYSAVSFKSGGDIIYYYKLDGLDHDWKKTTENLLEYQTLPSGNYRMNLYAVNKFGLRSAVFLIPFNIETPFYKTIWFVAAFSILIFGTIVFIFFRRNKLLERKLIEKGNLEKAFADLEQQALQAQMNPHFIFNCLNSIQQFILLNEKQKANQYLTGFASLIRQTLYISGKKSVTVKEEVEYLTNYLEMEKMRFGDSFEFQIVGYDDPFISRLQLPALFLQPYVENSLRHGIRYKQQGTGKSLISFSIEHEHLVCRIVDNGVGRAKAAEFKNQMPAEYQSKGISLSERRIDLLNKLYDTKITYDIIDLVDEKNEGIGTEVIVKIPV
jgi:ligand-binding sensor domain-containing protein